MGLDRGSKYALAISQQDIIYLKVILRGNPMLNLKVLLLILISSPSIGYANYEMEKLVDSYQIAKAELENPKIDQEEVQKHPFSIQVASYINEKDAVSHVNELKAKKELVKYYPTFVRGQVWFKVYVGEFDSKEKAESFRKEFVKRVDEPFSVVVSLLDNKDKDRTPASVEVKPEPAIAEKESAPVAEHLDSGNPSPHDPMPDVKLMPKSHIKEGAKVAKANPKPAKVPHAENKEKTSEASKHFYTVQIGAYPTEKDVKEFISRNTSSNVSFHYRSAVVDGKTWYRLFMGRFGSKKEAENFKNELRKDTKKDTKDGSFIRRVPATE